MKRLNRNGFAISTMLYGLLIVMVLLMSLLMSTISFARSNSKKFVSNVIKDLEFRDLTPPTVTLTNNTTQKMLYTKTEQELSLSFQISDDSALDLKIVYLTTFYIGNQDFNSSCDVKERSDDMKTATITCQLIIPDTNTATGKIFITTPVIQDIYGNSSSEEKKETNYEVRNDDIAPTFELLSSKSGQYYPRDLTNDFIKVQLCDNSEEKPSFVDAKTKNDIVIKVGDESQQTTLIENLSNQNNCHIFEINYKPFLTEKFINDRLVLEIPGKDTGINYGWKDKSGNINSKTIINTDIYFVNDNEISLRLDPVKPSIYNTDKEYKLEGDIRMISSSCSSQGFHYVGEKSPTCRIDNHIITDCKLEIDKTQEKLHYKIKINSNNKATGKLYITVPDSTVEDCYGRKNSEVTLYLGPTFVKS